MTQKQPEFDINVELVGDGTSTIPNGIEKVLHCPKCLDEWRTEYASQPGNQLTPRDHARIQVGIRPDGRIQIWCNRHNCNVGLFNVNVSVKPAAKKESTTT